MIITMKNTETREISAKIDELHEERGEAALGRVLTLLISTNETSLEHDLAVANNASREHPCRVIAIAPNSRKVDAVVDDGKPHTFLDAEVRFGSDAGAGEIIVLRPLGGLVHHPDTLVIPLLVPDAPVVAWWPNEARRTCPPTCWDRWPAAVSRMRCIPRIRYARWMTCVVIGRRRTWICRGPGSPYGAPCWLRCSTSLRICQ